MYVNKSIRSIISNSDYYYESNTIGYYEERQ